MPRKRMIDPGIWHSEQVASLTLRQRLLFIGLISNADDEGKLKGSANYVKSIVFPYDSIPILTIEADLKRITSQSIIVRYRVAQVWYIYLPTWKKHQYIREPRPSHIPDPPGMSTPPSTPPPTLKEPNGTQTNLKQGKKMLCPDCKGTGEIGAVGHQRTCFTCKGKRLLWREDYELLRPPPL